MRLYFDNSAELLKGIEELSSELSIEITDREKADVIVNVKKAAVDEVNVSLKGKMAEITYSSPIRFYRALGILCEALSDGKTEFSKIEKPSFEINGSMFDVARNMVLRPEIIKAILRKQALMGLNLFMIYLEDVFEVPEYPYFGHMRGRYTKEELRDLDSYAQIFGIELLPAIQCLGHLSQGIQWEAMAELRDTIDTMMVGREAVYQFIDKMMASVSECFSTKRLHIGMDEAHNVGHGRYLENNEYKPQFELFCEHMSRICEIAKKYDFELMAWSDMFFYMITKKHYSSKVTFDEEKLSLVPKDVHLVYWKYCVFDPEENEAILKLHKKLSDKVSYAGGIQTWTGAAPLYDVTIDCAKFALDACIRNNIKEVMATIWCNGGESTMITALYGLTLYAEMDYNGTYNEEEIKKRFKYICGVDADDLIDLAKINYPAGRKNTEKWTNEDYVNTSKYLLFNDPLIGLMDKHIEGMDAGKFYSDFYENYKNRGTKEGLFAPAFNYLKAIMYVLSIKADFGLRLKKAYDEKDMKALDVLYEDSKEVERRLLMLREVAREFYFYYNKQFGFEVVEMRFVTLAARFETVRYHIDKLRENPSYKIEELEEERRYLIAPEDAERVTLMEYDFGKFFSANAVYKVFDDFMIG